MYDLLRWYLAGVLGSVLFWFGVGAMTPAEEPTITDAPYRALTALNLEWMGVESADAGEWERYRTLVGEASAHWCATKESLGGDEKKPADWPDGYDWPYDTAQALSPTAPAVVRDATIRAVEELESAGLFERLEAARRTLRPVRVFDDTQASILDTTLPELGPTRNTARVLRIRMSLAAQRGDEAAALESARQIFWLTHAANQSVALGSLVSHACSMLAAHEIGLVVHEHPFSDETLRALDEVLAGHDARAVMRLGFRGERIVAEDQIQRLFTRDANGQGFFVWSTDAIDLLGDGEEPLDRALTWTGAWAGLLFGSRREHEAAFDAHYHATLEATNARSNREFESDEWDLLSQYSRLRFLTLHVLTVSITKPAMITRHAEARLAGTRIQIALARHRLKHGRDADTLAALVPAFLPAIPLDSISGMDWKYTRLDQPDEHGRTFLLYSVGFDGVDNGGHHHDLAWRLTEDDPDVDYVINGPREW